MTTRKKVLALLFASTVSVAILSLNFTPEPHYQGLSLTDWIDLREAHIARKILYWAPEGQTPIDPHEREADAAIRQIGSAALPCLLKWINSQPSSWKMALNKKRSNTKAGVLRSAPANKIFQWLDLQSDSKLRSKAYNTFIALGTAAVPAISDLEKIASDPNAPGADYAASVLIRLNAVASLTNVLNKNHDPAQQMHVLKGLGWLVNSATSALPAIIICAKDPNAEVAATAVATLGRIRLNPKVTVPVLSEALEDPRYTVRFNAVQALALYEAEAKSAVPSLEKLTSNPDLALSGAATQILRELSKSPELFEGDFSELPQ